MMRRIPRSELTAEPVPLAQGRELTAVTQKLALHAAHAHALTQAERDIVDITQRAVGALLQAELTLSPEHIRSVVHQLVQEVRAARQITVQVHPSDRALLPSAHELATHAEAQGAIEIVDNPSLAPGDCVITSELGDIDARLSTKLEQLQQLLTQQMSR